MNVSESNLIVFLRSSPYWYFRLQMNRFSRSNFSHVLINVDGLLKQSIYMLMFVDCWVLKLLSYK